jgi:hypothetical protein
VPFDNLLANLHAEEMVVPAGPARLLRDLLVGGASSGGWRTTASGGGSGEASSALSTSNGGAGTLILQLDGQELTRIVDQRIAVREDLVTIRPVGGSQW